MDSVIIPIVLLACAQPNIINNSGAPLTNEDYKTLNYCKTRCETDDKTTPCLKKFIKLTKLRDYACICGEETP